MLAFLQSNWTFFGMLGMTVAVSCLRSHSIMARQLTLSTVSLLFYRLIRFIVSHRGKGLGWLGSPPLVYLGSISYALYMYQGFVIYGFQRLLGPIPASHEGLVLLRAALVLSACFVVCTISRYALELPAQKLRRFELRSRQVPSIDVHAAQGTNLSIET
jgi:peptidoglycan/LPS O-acetylase OafA/YrhL